MSESPEDMMSRLQAMVDDVDGDTWDLSPKDEAAIQFAISERQRLQDAILQHGKKMDALMKEPASYDRGRKISQLLGELEAAAKQ